MNLFKRTRVYCKNCVYLSHNGVGDTNQGYRCNHEKNVIRNKIEYDWFDKTYVTRYKRSPHMRNACNDCSWYKRRATNTGLK